MESSKRTTYIIAAVSLLFIVAAVYFLFIRSKGPAEIKKQESTGEVKNVTDIDLAKRPYLTLTPTTDGAEIIISIEKMAEFDKIEYELTYLADNPQAAGEKITRGATGVDVNPKDQEYKKNILLGTASKGVRSPDRGVTDGKLTLHLFKGETEYQSESPWDLIQAAQGAETIKDRTGNFQLSLPSLGKSYWAIVADTLGIPPKSEFDAKGVLLPIYGTFSIAPEFKSNATLTIKLEKDVKAPQLYSYDHAVSTWQKVESKYSGGTVSAGVSNFATFVVVSQ